MTDLDRQVAKLRGWIWDDDNEWWTDTDGAVLLGSAAYLPSTNLWQAVALWDEARPEGYRLEVILFKQDDCMVCVWHRRGPRSYKPENFADLPRAITEAWVEAMEAT